MKTLMTVSMAILSFLSCKSQTPKEVTNYVGKQTIYQFKVQDINGKTFDFATLQGKKIMIVNTASKCGLTPQYKDLEALYKKYESQNFIIIGFPANNFLKQEPASDSTIAEFCSLNYGVTFPMMSKISVKGNDMAPLYEYLTKYENNGYSNNSVSWNFQKYLINELGYLVKVITPATSPMDKEIIDWIEKK